MTFFFLFLSREYVIISTDLHMPVNTTNVLSGVASYSTFTIAGTSKETVASCESLLTLKHRAAVYRTVHRAPCTVHRAPCTVHRAPCTVNRVPCTIPCTATQLNRYFLFGVEKPVFYITSPMLSTKTSLEYSICM